MIELDFIPVNTRKDFEKAFARDDAIQSLQLLSDLGYLPAKAFDELSVSQENKRKAIARFRMDYQEFKADSESSNFGKIYQDALQFENEKDDHTLSEREYFLLKELTGLEGELQIRKVPLDRSSLLSRVTIYRYKVYDLAKEVRKDSIFSKEVERKIKQAVGLLTDEMDWISFTNMLADQSQLSDFAINSPILNSKLYDTTLFFRVEKKYRKELEKEYGDFDRKLKSFLEVIPDGPNKTVIKTILTQGRNDPQKYKEEIQKYKQALENQFLLRVLQVKLWVLGLYEGKLDTDFGSLTFRALYELLDYISDKAEGGKKEFSKMLYRINKEQWALNYEFLLTKYLHTIDVMELGDTDSSVSKVYDFVIEKHPEEDTLTADEKKQINEGRKEVIDTLETDLTQYSKDINLNERRRQYKGKTGIRRLLSRLFGWIKKGVKFLLRLIKKILKIIKKSIKIIFSEIKEAIQSFTRGIGFLIGKRIVKNEDGSIITDFDFDFDGLTVVNENTDASLLKSHSTMIQEKASAVYPSLRFLRIVIEWGVQLASGVGWIKILIGIAKLFKDFIVKKIKEGKEVVAIS